VAQRTKPINGISGAQNAQGQYLYHGET